MFHCAENGNLEGVKSAFKKMKLDILHLRDLLTGYLKLTHKFYDHLHITAETVLARRSGGNNDVIEYSAYKSEDDAVVWNTPSRSLFDTLIYILYIKRNELLEEGLISQHTWECLKQLKRNVIASQADRYDFDLFRTNHMKYYEDYMDRVNKLCDLTNQTLYKEPATEAIDDILKSLKDITKEVVGPKILDAIDDMFQCGENGNTQGAKSVFEEMKEHIKSLEVKLKYYCFEIIRDFYGAVHGVNPYDV